jgi:hypothetical protein
MPSQSLRVTAVTAHTCLQEKKFQQYTLNIAIPDSVFAAFPQNTAFH